MIVVILFQVCFVVSPNKRSVTESMWGFQCQRIALAIVEIHGEIETGESGLVYVGVPFSAWGSHTNRFHGDVDFKF